MKNYLNILTQINKASHPLIVICEHSSSEIICAGLALYNHFLAKKKKISIIYAKNPDQRLAFLDSFLALQKKIKKVNDLIISLNTFKNKIKNISYQEEANKFKIFITPKKKIKKTDFDFQFENINYDLIIVLGSPDLQTIGGTFEENTELFFNTPILNIDNKINNEQYGEINLIEVKVAGISELVAKILLEDKDSIDQATANCLYTGIIEATESFQSPRTSPYTLKTASQLIKTGADQKKIVKNLFKNQDLNTIKLWGKVMSKMIFEKKFGLCFSYLSKKDLENQEISQNQIKLIFDKIRSSYDKNKTFLLLWEKEETKTRGLIQNANQELLKEITQGKLWGKAVYFKTNKSLEKTKNKIFKLYKREYLEDEV
jgi:nanoRNase/pAp phosphatase (c-di-AMP/oligoRNAs hydrolase)